MRAARTLTALSLLLASAAPAPGPTAKGKLEALKKRLPDVLRAWEKAHFGSPFSVTVLRRVRATGDTEAKLVFGVHLLEEGKPAPEPRHLLTVFLKFHDGHWTTVRSEWSEVAQEWWKEATHFLLDAIDEAGE